MDQEFVFEYSEFIRGEREIIESFFIFDLRNRSPFKILQIAILHTGHLSFGIDAFLGGNSSTGHHFINHALNLFFLQTDGSYHLLQASVLHFSLAVGKRARNETHH